MIERLAKLATGVVPSSSLVAVALLTGATTAPVTPELRFDQAASTAWLADERTGTVSLYDGAVPEQAPLATVPVAEAGADLGVVPAKSGAVVLDRTTGAITMVGDAGREIEAVVRWKDAEDPGRLDVVGGPRGHLWLRSATEAVVVDDALRAATQPIALPLGGSSEAVVGPSGRLWLATSDGAATTVAPLDDPTSGVTYDAAAVSLGATARSVVAFDGAAGTIDLLEGGGRCEVDVAPTAELLTAGDVIAVSDPGAGRLLLLDDDCGSTALDLPGPRVGVMAEADGWLVLTLPDTQRAWVIELADPANNGTTPPLSVDRAAPVELLAAGDVVFYSQAETGTAGVIRTATFGSSPLPAATGLGAGATSGDDVLAGVGLDPDGAVDDGAEVDVGSGDGRDGDDEDPGPDGGGGDDERSGDRGGSSRDGSGDGESDGDGEDDPTALEPTPSTDDTVVGQPEVVPPDDRAADVDQPEVSDVAEPAGAADLAEPQTLEQVGEGPPPGTDELEVGRPDGGAATGTTPPSPSPAPPPAQPAPSGAGAENGSQTGGGSGVAPPPTVAEPGPQPELPPAATPPQEVLADPPVIQQVLVDATVTSLAFQVATNDVCAQLDATVTDRSTGAVVATFAEGAGCTGSPYDLFVPDLDPFATYELTGTVTGAPAANGRPAGRAETVAIPATQGTTLPRVQAIDLDSVQLLTIETAGFSFVAVSNEVCVTMRFDVVEEATGTIVSSGGAAPAIEGFPGDPPNCTGRHGGDVTGLRPGTAYELRVTLDPAPGDGVSPGGLVLAAPPVEGADLPTNTGSAQVVTRTG